MTEAEWLTCDEPRRMLGFLHADPGDRRLQRFAVACCRRIWHRIPDPRSRKAVETAERFIEGEVGVEEVEAACRGAEVAQREVRLRGRWDDGENAAVALALLPRWNPESWPSAYSVAAMASCAAASFAELSGKNRKGRKRASVRGLKDEDAAQCALLRDIFGNPFQPVPVIEPAVLAWNERTVVRLTQGAYENRHLPGGTLHRDRLAVLADALEEAGVTDPLLLEHLRGPGPHVRGCHVLGAILDKS